MRYWEMIVAALVALLAAAAPVAAQPIENERVLISPVGKSFSDSALANTRLRCATWTITHQSGLMPQGPRATPLVIVPAGSSSAAVLPAARLLANPD